MRSPRFLRPWILSLAAFAVVAPVPRALAEEKEERPRRAPERRRPSPRRDSTPRVAPRPVPERVVRRPEVRRTEETAPQRRPFRIEPRRTGEATAERRALRERPAAEARRDVTDRRRLFGDRRGFGFDRAFPSRPALGREDADRGDRTPDRVPDFRRDRDRTPFDRSDRDRTGFTHPDRDRSAFDRPDRTGFTRPERTERDLRGTHRPSIREPARRGVDDLRATRDRATRWPRHDDRGTGDLRTGRDLRGTHRDDRGTRWRGAFHTGVRPAAPALRRGIPYRRHSHYDRHGIRLSFNFSYGSYTGWQYYSPFHHYVSGCDYAFFYPDVVSYCYVPFGFICDAPPVYVTRYVYVHEAVPVETYEVVEGIEDVPADDAPVVEPEPAAGSPVAERYLRDGSEAFRAADYREAARLFRLAALSAPGKAGPLFALGQALLALGDDAYAARVIRKAFLAEPALAGETGDIVGVFESRDEFDRVFLALEDRARASEPGSDARFLLAVERYFSGDPKAREDLALLAAVLPGDEVVDALRTAADERFAEDLPPVDPR